MIEFFSSPDVIFVRLLFERTLAILYFVAFLSSFNQFPALLGENGLLPVPHFLKFVTFKQAPSLFHYKYSDSLLRFFTCLGMGVSLLITFGGMDHAPILLHMVAWLSLYVLYLSLVNVGQIFFGFGWESMILEAGFFMAFMGPRWVMPSMIPILILRWMLFRTEFGAGLIKWRGDSCWRDLTCLYYHHETQPLPNPLSQFFHWGPKAFHRMGVVFSHFVQLITPFFLFLPQPFAMVGGAFMIIHQLILVSSGNYSWLNWITIALGFLAFTDGPIHLGEVVARPLWFESIQWIVGLFALALSYRPAFNLVGKKQKMNYCWNRFHLVCAYGAFGSVTKKRYEIVIEGSTDSKKWKEYEFKGKPGDLKRRPPIVAPYHLRLDWMIWFLPFSVLVGDKTLHVYEYEDWFLSMIKKLLQNDRPLLKLFRKNPFASFPPQAVRAQFYLYQFTTIQEFKSSGDVWKRTLVGEYLPTLSLEDFNA